MEDIEALAPKKKFPTLSGVVGIVLLLFVASAIIGGALVLLLPNNRPATMALSYIVPFGLVTGILLMVQKHDFGASFKGLLRPFNLAIVPFLLFFVLGFGYVADNLVSLIPMPAWFESYLKELIQLNWWSFITVCIAAPLLEELLCRGVFLRSFLLNYSVKKALFWSAFIFAFLHLNPWQALPAFGLGYLMAWLFYRTNSLIPALIIHFVNNFVAYMSSYYFGTDFEIAQSMDWRLNMAFSLFGLGLALYSFYRIRRILAAEV